MKLDQDTKVWAFVIMVVVFAGIGRQVVTGMGFVNNDKSNVGQLAFMVLALAVGAAWAIIYGNPFREKPPADGPKT